MDRSVQAHVMRRSTRLELEIPVLVTGLEPSCRYCEEGRTVAVNAHGCGVVVAEPLAKGTSVLIDLLLEVGSTRARVVDSLLLTPGKWLLGLEFARAGNLWKIANPPDDWNSTQDVVAAPVLARRESTLVRWKVPFHLRALNPENAFAESTLTVTVSREGCSARLTRALPHGEPVLLEGLPLGRSVGAKITRCDQMEEPRKLYRIDIALDEPANVWGIPHPPEDWCPRGSRGERGDDSLPLEHKP